jgi:hypothetical protein
MRVILGQPEGIRISCSPIQLHNIRQQLWDSGILAIYECIFFRVNSILYPTVCHL